MDAELFKYTPLLTILSSVLNEDTLRKDCDGNKKIIVNAMNDLDGRIVIALLLTASGFTLANAGVVMGCHGERVRQIRDKGLRQLRHPKRIEMLKKCVYE